MLVTGSASFHVYFSSVEQNLNLTSSPYLVRSIDLSDGVKTLNLPARYHFDRTKDHEKVHDGEDL